MIEDRRTYHPLGDIRPARSLVESYPAMFENVVPQRFTPFWRGTPYDPKTGEIQRLVPSKVDPSGWTYIPDRPGVLEKARHGRYAFENPWKVIICLKRKMRREIMHAMGMAGKTGFRSPRFTQYSYVRCF